MHEFSVMSQIVSSILEEAGKRNALRVEEVVLELGEFTMLGEEQMRFSYDVLARDNVLEGSELVIKHVKGTIRCDCGFEGAVSVSEDTPHRPSPVLECPECHGPAAIATGRECVIRDIRMVVPDV
jgi:hydrogenase nickel incorporation protein HypA/HybF